LTTKELKGKIGGTGHIFYIDRIDRSRVDDLIQLVLTDIKPLGLAIFCSCCEVSGRSCVEFVIMGYEKTGERSQTFIMDIEVTGVGKASIGPPYDRDISSTGDEGTHFIVPSSEMLKGWNGGNKNYKKRDPKD